MAMSLLKRKLKLFNGEELAETKCVKSLDETQGRYLSEESLSSTPFLLNRTPHGIIKPVKSCNEPRGSGVCLNGSSNSNIKTKRINELSSWTDTQRCVSKVLNHIKPENNFNNLFLEESISQRFVEFHSEITEECGEEDKQHSWAVVEKREELLIYGPYYPNYSSGEHSEDSVIKQTQELLKSKEASENWKVYIFTLNSPCLARNTNPCMLNLVQKAFDWYIQHGIKTYIGYRKCWGFKGTKENLFRAVSYFQLECICRSSNYETYRSKTKESTENTVFSEGIYTVVKQFLSLEKLCFKFQWTNSVQQSGRICDFKSMLSTIDFKSQAESELLSKEILTMLEAVQFYVSEKIDCLEGYLKMGTLFSMNYRFDPQICDTECTKLRHSFEKCWKDVVHDKYAEFFREMLTEDFNRCTVQLFTKDVRGFTEEHIHIGQIKFPEVD